MALQLVCFRVDPKSSRKHHAVLTAVLCTFAAICAAFASFLAHETAAECSQASLKAPSVILSLWLLVVVVLHLWRRWLLVLHLRRGLLVSVSTVHQVSTIDRGQGWCAAVKLTMPAEAVVVGSTLLAADSRLADSTGLRTC